MEKSVIRLRQAGPERAEIFPRSDFELREALRNANEIALIQASLRREAGRPWRYAGFQDARTLLFLRDGSMWEDWGG